MATLTLPRVAELDVRAARRTDTLARYTAGLLLLAAAAFKVHDGVFLTEFGGFEAWRKPFSVAVVGFEVALGLVLLTGAVPRVAKRAAVVTFAMFAAYTAWRWAGGYASCGCFGGVRVDPRVTLAVDVGVIGLFLLSSAPRFSTPSWRAERRILQLTAAAWLVLALPAGAAMVVSRPTSLDALAGGAADADAARPVRLDPDAWVGRRLPVLPYLVDAPADLTRGRWTVILWHVSCGHCWNRLPDLLARHEAGPNARGVVVVHTVPPPYPRDTTARLVEASGGRGDLHETTLDPARRWSSATPVPLTLVDGVVAGVR